MGLLQTHTHAPENITSPMRVPKKVKKKKKKRKEKESKH